MPDEIKNIQTESTVTSQTSSYRSIFKSTSLFGGVQVYIIIISIIKSKFVAILLGPAGVGLQGLFTSATQLIQGISSFGLSQSAIRNVSEAHASGNFFKVSTVVTVLRRLVWLTGLLGTVLVLVFSPRLSQTTFGSNDYVIPLMFLSITLLIDQICAGQRVVLQGTRRLKDLAKASAYGATVSLFVTVPIYYFWGIKGIVPTLILNSSLALLFSWYFSRRISIQRVKMNYKAVFHEGKGLMQMGVAMSISGILVYLSSYVLRSYIRMEGGVESVGLFTAGFTLMNTYAGLVFNAMSTDYYPRLASVNKDNIKCREIMNQQAEVGLLILAPLMAACIIFVPVVVKLLYSTRFIGANTYIIWCALGMLFKLASWSVAFVFVAKGESKLFIINEVISGVYTLAFNLLGYHIAGLTGLGISFLVGYLIYTIQVYFVSRFKYDFSFSKDFLHIFLIHFFFVAACLCLVILSHSTIFKYFVGVLIVVLSFWYSLRELDKRMDLTKIIFNKIVKK